MDILPSGLWGQIMKAVMHTAGLKQRESCRDSFKQLKILAVYSLYNQETIICAKQKCNCAVNKQVHTSNTRNNDYPKYVHNWELYITVNHHQQQDVSSTANCLRKKQIGQKGI
jgi:hypothetical protein